MKALFCEHEGYFGAVGCLLELMKLHRSQPPSPFLSHKMSHCDKAAAASHVTRDDEEEEEEDEEKVEK